jgi:hypothetical protein
LSSSEVTQDVPTTGTVVLPPAPRSLEALGRSHTLEAALAELVDNSIDASASHALIRFMQHAGRLTQLLVVDDGRGMDEAEIDIAMTVGGEREYAADSIGRFGFGLKAASFSQADELTVLSRKVGGAAVGRRWRLEQAKADFTCEVVDSSFANTSLDTEWDLPPATSGTIVRWDAVRGFPAVASGTEVDRFLHAAFARIRTHLGLIYNRLLQRQRVRIYIDVQDVVEGLGQRVEIAPLDPLGYPRTGVAGWPKPLQIDAGDAQGVALDCHIWPGRSTLEQFRLDGNLIARQGIYVYYNDRLIQRGGWNGLVHADKRLNLARASVDIAGDIDGFMTLRPGKNGIEPGPRFAHLITGAQFSDGAAFTDYLDTARSYLKETNRRNRARRARIPPGSGFDPRLRRAIEREIPMKDEEPLSIRWAPLPAEQFFDVDREESTLWLNKRFRSALLGGYAGTLNDLPVMKAVLYLLFEEVFSGDYLGARDKDNIELWQEILVAAAEAETL